MVGGGIHNIRYTEFALSWVVCQVSLYSLLGCLWPAVVFGLRGRSPGGSGGVSGDGGLLCAQVIVDCRGLMFDVL